MEVKKKKIILSSMIRFEELQNNVRKNLVEFGIDHQ